MLYITVGFAYKHIWPLSLPVSEYKPIVLWYIPITGQQCSRWPRQWEPCSHLARQLAYKMALGWEPPSPRLVLVLILQLSLLFLSPVCSLLGSFHKHGLSVGESPPHTNFNKRGHPRGWCTQKVQKNVFEDRATPKLGDASRLIESSYLVCSGLSDQSDMYSSLLSNRPVCSRLSVRRGMGSTGPGNLSACLPKA